MGKIQFRDKFRAIQIFKINLVFIFQSASRSSNIWYQYHYAMDSTDFSDLWLQSISEAVECIQRDNEFDGIEPLLNASLAYLSTLENALVQYQESWDFPPRIPPPSWEQKNPPQDHFNNKAVIVPSSNQVSALRGNRYASIVYNDESSSDEEEQFDDGGDVLIVNKAHLPVTATMNMRRLVIRIITAQSEILAKLGNVSRNPKQKLLEAADFYLLSLQRIRLALSFADMEIARLFEIKNRNYRDLVEDASIVGVAIGSLASQYDDFKKALLVQQQRLLRRLEPQWSSRDKAKSKWGENWTKNPSPTNHFANLRAQDEEKYREVQAVLAKLATMNIEEAKEESKKMMSRLDSRKKNGTNNVANRLNGERPSDVSGRVSRELYPDPTEFGWYFTGSHKYIEYFERGEFRIEWYFTRAALKVVSTNQENRMKKRFLPGLTSEAYIQMLQNPATYVNIKA
jgi:hypothetical protein